MQNNAPILLAEDDEHERFFIRLALERSGVANPVIAVEDGREAVDYLAGVGPYADRAAHPLPGLLLLDLKMPKMSGLEVLAWLSTQPDFNELPVVVLSSSGLESDIKRAIELGADDFQVKPVEFERLVDIIRSLHSRWLARESKPS
jgi:CheY-like chemotaxis protein